MPEACDPRGSPESGAPKGTHRGARPAGADAARCEAGRGCTGSAPVYFGWWLDDFGRLPSGALEMARCLEMTATSKGSGASRDSCGVPR